MKRIFLVRHGETDWNREGRFQGQMDIPLNRTGLEQARSVAEALKDVPLDRIVASPLSRAFETARTLAVRKGLSVDTEADFREISHGLWEGRTADEVDKEWAEMLYLWHSHPEAVEMPGGESLADVHKRTWNAFQRLSERVEGSIVLVSHDAVLKVLLCAILGCPFGSFWRFQVANGSISLLEHNDNGWCIPLLGEASHLGDPFFRREQKGL